MTSEATRIRKGDEAHTRGVNAAVLVLHEARAAEKNLPPEQRGGSAVLSMALQFTAIAAVENGADMNAVLNACCDLTGWALAQAKGPASQARWATFQSMTADMLARADKHAAAITLANVEPEGQA